MYVYWFLLRESTCSLNAVPIIMHKHFSYLVHICFNGGKNNEKCYEVVYKEDTE